MEINRDRDQLKKFNEGHNKKMKEGVNKIEKEKHLRQISEGNNSMIRQYEAQAAGIKDQLVKLKLVDKMVAEELAKLKSGTKKVEHLDKK